MFLPPRRVDEAVRDGVPLPAPFAPVLVRAFEATIERLGVAAAPATTEPEPVVPGSLGLWTDDERDVR